MLNKGDSIQIKEVANGFIVEPIAQFNAMAGNSSMYVYASIDALLGAIKKHFGAGLESVVAEGEAPDAKA